MINELLSIAVKELTNATLVPTRVGEVSEFEDPDVPVITVKYMPREREYDYISGVLRVWIWHSSPDELFSLAEEVHTTLHQRRYENSVVNLVCKDVKGPGPNLFDAELSAYYTILDVKAQCVKKST